MKKKLYLLSIIFCVQFVVSGGLYTEVGKHLGIHTIFESALEEQRKQLVDLEKERDQLEATQPEFEEITEKEIASITNQLVLIKEDLKQQPEDEFLLKKQSILNDRLATLKDQIVVRKQLIEDKNELIKVISSYLSDPNQEEFIKELKLFEVTTITFEDIQTLKQQILDHEKGKKFLATQENNSKRELESRNRILTSLKESFKKEKDDFDAAMDAEVKPFELDKRQRRELYNLKEKLFKEKEDLEKLRIAVIETKRSIFRKKTTISEKQSEILKKVLNRSKSIIVITQADIVAAKDELTKKERQYREQEELFRRELEKWPVKKTDLELASKQYNVPIGTDLDEWSREPKQTVDGYIALLEVGLKNDDVLLAQREKELLQARWTLEEVKYKNESLKVELKETYYTITGNRFKSADEIQEAIEKYKTLKAQVEVASFEAKKNTAEAQLATQKKALENIRERRREIERQATVIFRGKDTEYNRVISLLNSIEEIILKQVEKLNRVIDVYNDIISINKGAQKQIDLVSQDLPGALQIFRRPETAISLAAVKSIVPELQQFVKDLYFYLTTFSLDSVINKIRTILAQPYDLLFFFIKLLFLILFLLFIRLYLPRMLSYIAKLVQEGTWSHWFVYLINFLGSFIFSYFMGLSLWVLFYFVVHNLRFIDPYLLAIFYLGSIPYFIYLGDRFVRTFLLFNEKNNFCLLSKQFQRHISIVFTIFVYSTITISLFSAAFSLLADSKAEVPRILWALNLIILQIAVVFLLSKELILYLIPTTTDIGKMIQNFVDNYYYILLPIAIAIIFLSNPYVGYGQLVWYVLSRLLLTGLVITFLFWIHKLFKKISAAFFFSQEEETVKERFSYAKTWYGLWVIFIFLALILTGVFICAKIWNWPEALSKIRSIADIRAWIYTPLILKETETPISLASIFEFISFIFGGVFVAYIFNRFVLGRIFDVLLVEPGVQNAVATITRYIILFAAGIFGLLAIGLGENSLLILLGSLVLGIGWVLKDPVLDFFSYMLILVQRPLKIGDYVMLDNETRGVVRRITARAVILRRKNSTTIIVPNAQLMKKTLINWNYTPGFVALDDIHVTVTYKNDPVAVRKLLLDVMAENPYILKNPKPISRLDDFGEIGYVFMLRGFISSNYTLEMWNIASGLRLDIVDALKKNGMDLAIPIWEIISTSKNYPFAVSKDDDKFKE